MLRLSRLGGEAVLTPVMGPVEGLRRLEQFVASVRRLLAHAFQQRRPLAVRHRLEAPRDPHVLFQVLHAVDPYDQRGDREAQGVADTFLRRHSRRGGYATAWGPARQALHADYPDVLP